MKKALTKILSLVLAVAILMGMLVLPAAAAVTGRNIADPIIITMGESYTKTWTKDTDHLYWYNKITVTESGILNLTFTKPYDSEGELGRLIVVLYDSEANTVWDTESYSSRQSASMSYNWHVGIPAGVYYVLVKPGFSVTSGVITSTYSFTFTPDAYCELEPNESAATATPVVYGHLYTGYFGSEGGDAEDYDYYKVYMTSGVTYKVALDMSKLASTSTMVDILSPDGDDYYLSYYIKESGMIDDSGYPYVNYTAKSSGYYFIRFENNSYGSQQIYHLRVVAPPCKTHSWDSGSVTKQATCVADGVKTITCRNCGTTKTEKIPALGHSWDKGVITVQPTELKPGKKVCTCSRCGATKTEILKATSDVFTDTEPSAFYYTPVLWAVSKGITKGTSRTTFSPDDTCTRGQIVTFLWRAMGSPKPKTATNPFTDVKKSDFFYKAVLWAVENGITAGTSKTTFSPNDGCTRGQVVTFLWRAEGKPAAKSPSSFSDVASTAFYAKAVAWAVGEGITKGTSGSKFSPDDTCTRGQIVTFLYRDLA